jgi:hypothetical protein
MLDKLEFKIINDGAERNPEHMTLVEAKAFMILYQSLVEIVNLTEGNENSKISIQPNLLSTCVEGTVAAKIKDDFDNIASSTSLDAELIRHWNNLKTLVRQNGLHFDFVHHINGKQISLIEKIQDAKKFYKKIERKTYSTSIKFFVGKLIELGGKTPAIYIDLGSHKISISCDEKNATKAKDYLYKDILVSVWSKQSEENEQYILCDIYEDEQVFLDFKTFIENIAQLDELDALFEIHDRVQTYLEENNIELLKRFSILWISPLTDIQTLKTLLVITKDFKLHEDYGTYRSMLLSIYDDKYLKLAKKLKRN